MGGGLRLTCQPLDAGSQGQMLALDLLRVTFASVVHFWGQLSRVHTPMIGMIASDPKRLQQRFQLHKQAFIELTGCKFYSPAQPIAI